MRFEISPVIAAVRSAEEYAAALESGAETVFVVKSDLLRRLWALESSFSYKLGRFLTWIPRKTAAFFRCWHTKGFKYTMVRVFRGKKRAQEYLARREND